MRTLFFVAALATSVFAFAQSAEVKNLLKEEAGLTDKCRGGSGDAPQTMKACTKRDAVVKKLQGLGWCYGEKDQAGYQMEWHPCGATKQTRLSVAYVMSRIQGQLTEGSPIPRSEVITVLYENMPCAVPLSSARDMQAAEILYGRNLVPACWGRLLGPTSDNVLIVNKFGNTYRESLYSYVSASVTDTGELTVTGHAYSGDQFRREVKEYHDSMR